jgi:hypothetical protein
MPTLEPIHKRAELVRADLSLRIGDVGDLRAFLIPACLCFEIDLIGRLFLSDILLLATLPFVWRQMQRALRSGTWRTLVLAGVLWLANQIATDVLRGTPFDNMARGWSKIGLFVLNLAIIPALIGSNRKRAVLYALGCAAGFLIATQVSPDPWFWADHWKFGYSQPFNFAMAIAATLTWARGHKVRSVALLFSCACVNGFMGARGTAAAAFGAAVLLALSVRSRRAPSLGQNLRVILAVAIALVVGSNLYVALARAGQLGEAIQAKVEAETSGDLGIIVGGRNLLLAGVERIVESPLIGMGSWATGGDYIASAASVLQAHGYTITRDTLQQADPHTLSHSHLIGAWVEAGVFGGLFWILVLSVTARRLLGGRWRDEPLSPLILFAGCMLIWDIMFSPFAQERRFINPYFMYCAIKVTEIQRRSVKRPTRITVRRQEFPLERHSAPQPTR